MNILNVFTRPKTDSEDLYEVFWSSRREGAGRLEVEIRDQKLTEYRAEVAELAAIRYLIVDRQIFNKAFSGPGLKLVTAQPEVCCMIEPGYTNSASRYATYFPIRHRGMTVELDSGVARLIDEKRLEDTSLVVSTPELEIVDVPAIGPVAITKHAIDQYIRKSTDGAPTKDPWKSLCKRLCNPDLILVDLALRPKLAKLVKYGKVQGGLGQMYRHPTSTLHFQVTDKDEKGVRHLVTVFERLPGK